ncbi:MAG: isoprenylcysteine carboxylmethyltransferase family protein [Syntrophobacterales bacterium]
MIYLLVVMTSLLGGGSLFLFALFLFLGSLDLVNLGLDAATALGWDAGISLAFFVQHSVMIRQSCRRQLGRILSEKYHGLAYTMVSGVFLLGVVFFWQGLDYHLLTLTGWLRLVARLIFFLAMAGFFWGVLSLGFFDPFGLKPILPDRLALPAQPQGLVVRGPYRWVRHPLYLCVILLIWSCPDVTADRLLFNLLWTGWIIIGTRLEERDLVETFGQAYRDYQRQVPMLLPYRPSPPPKPE